MKIRWAPGHEPDPHGRRCLRCRRNRLRAHYYPYCSYHCQELAQMERNLSYVASLRNAKQEGR